MQAQPLPPLPALKQLIDELADRMAQHLKARQGFLDWTIQVCLCLDTYCCCDSTLLGSLKDAVLRIDRLSPMSASCQLVIVACSGLSHH